MKNFLSIFFATFLVFSSHATHNRAGEITYKRIAPFVTGVGSNTVAVYTYSITLIRYTDDGLTIADRCVDSIYFGDGTKGIAPRINGLLSCPCNSLNGVAIACGSLIVNQSSYKVKYNIYSITHTYAGPGIYLVSSYDPNRNANVINIPNSVNTPFYVESLIVINQLAGINSSPSLLNPPVDQATLGACFYHNPGAVDAEGDSLSYEMVPCNSAAGQTVSGYFYPQTGISGSFSINPTTGLLSWCTPQMIGEYNVAILIREWRKNTSGTYQPIGYVIRDMQILVKAGIVGLVENNFQNSIRIYPNPVEGWITVNPGVGNPGKIKSSLFTSTGNLVLQREDEMPGRELKFDLGNFPAGIYLLQIQTRDGVVTRKIVKQ